MFCQKDIDYLVKVIQNDDIVDGLFNTIKDELVDIIIENIDHSESGNYLLMIAKYLERIGDHS